MALLDHLGFANGLVVQGNAHVYDNSVVLDALTRFPARLRGVAITDTRIKPDTLHEWDARGMRGLRFHLFPQRPNYVRGVGLDVFAVFRKIMAELGWVVQFFCDHRMLAQTAPVLRDISRDMTVIVDHLGMVPAAQGVGDPNFQVLLKLVGDGHAYVKLSAVYRLSTQYSDYPDAKPLHDALIAANPERLMWGTDWPHPSIPADVMPDDGHLLESFSRLDAGPTDPPTHSGRHPGAAVRQVIKATSGRPAQAATLPSASRATMKRRPTSGGHTAKQTAKSRRPKAASPKGRNAPNGVRKRGISIAGQETVVARLTRDRDEALLREAANSEILHLISKSSGDLNRVFRTILENATRICNANFGNLWLRDGDAFRIAATHGAPPGYREYFDREPLVRPHPKSGLGVILETKRLVHIADVKGESTFKDKMRIATIELANARSLLGVPLLKENEVIGAIAIYRQVVRPFTDKQIELLQNFAAQALIAIENARLLSELRESLQQQTATAEVLKVIARTPGELQSVFETMLAKASELCEASYGALWLRVDDGFRYAALHGDLPQIWTDHLRNGTTIRVRPDVPLARLLQTLRPVSIPDMRTDPGYLNGDPLPVSGVDIGGIRTLVVVPMIKTDDLVGAIAIYRKEVRPFSEKQVELLSNFAAQAVIAIENARLLNELRESLQQQTAAAEVLKVISSSPGDLVPVFEAILINAVNICGARFGNLFLCDGDEFTIVAMHGAPAALTEWWRGNPTIRPGPQTGLARLVKTKRVNQTEDLKAGAAYAGGDPLRVATVELAGARTLIDIPLLKDDVLVGAIVIYRQEVRLFADKEIELLTNFAAQAVIAIENARLLNELRERTAQLESRSQEIAKLNAQLEQRVADQVGEIERMGRLRRFLPPQVADLIVASGTEQQLESHRREITALFCDLRGFTGFSESADPEDVMTLLRQYHAGIGEIIIKYSGTLERYAGDGVMVVFNDPVPVDNPALQAVRMALDMRMALGALIEKWRRLGHELGFGIGIAHGYATLGTIGFEGRFDYAAIGTVSNVASRLCDEAKPGQILISPRVLMAVEDAISVQPVGDFALKGISRPLAAYNVVGVKQSDFE
jgi:GAF domain-containing protein/predicted TIM-barrel fold metal-dependent hydrolase